MKSDTCTNKYCKRKVHFVSPEMCGVYKYARVKTDEGEILIDLPKPRFYFKGDQRASFKKAPLDVISGDMEAVYNSDKEGVQDDDPYYLKMEEIKKKYE